MSSKLTHIPVLTDPLMAHLPLTTASTIIDCTTGGGGHLANVLDMIPANAKVIALDQDPTAIAALEKKFSKFLATKQLILECANFSDLENVLSKHKLSGKVDGIYADLGISSIQLDDASRGFSFQQDGPLDMRLNTADEQRLTAEIIVNEWSLAELINIFKEFGEEPKAKAIASAILRTREKGRITRTKELAELVVKCVKYATKSRVHPATRVFQALRITVNNELEVLRSLLKVGFENLSAGGRLAVISFHSLEDRMVKQAFNALAGKVAEDSTMRGLPFAIEDVVAPLGKIIKPFPIIPTEDEVEENPRARSAKLRIIEKV